MTAPARSVFAEPLAQLRNLHRVAHDDRINCQCPACAALDLIEQRAKEMEAGNERLRETLARVRPDIDPETGYGRQEAI